MYNENDSTANNGFYAGYSGNAAALSKVRNTYAVDPDSVTRPGDGFYGGNPMLRSSTVARPLILNRAFRSVGEMGYASRGWGVWKSINFFSPQSGDAGLLDYCSIDSAPVAAGKSSQHP